MKRIFTLLAILLSITQFQSKAQSFCDSLDIQVAYSPFYDSLLEVRVWNNTSQFFNYPGFIIYNASGDTVAKEDLNLFGIGQSSVHVLHIVPGAITDPTFNGTMEFYTWGFDSLQCTYSMNFDLCPDTCQQAIIALGNYGGAMFTGDVHYDIRNSASQVVKSGMLVIGVSQQDADTTCLTPGNYTLHLSQINLTGGGQKAYTITRDSASYPVPLWTYNQTNDTSFSFSFYRNCAVTTSVYTPAVTSDELFATISYGKLYLRRTSTPIGNFSLYSMEGKKVIQKNITSSEATIDVSALPSGIYIVRTLHGHRYSNKKVVVH